MKVSYEQLSKAIRNSVVDVKNYREMLRGLHLYTKNDNLIVETCNGSALVRSAIHAEEPSDIDVVCAVPALPRVPKTSLVEIDIREKVVVFTAETGSALATKIDGDYPDFDTMFAKREESIVSVNPKLLIAALKGLADEKVVDLKFGTAVQPIIINGALAQAIVLSMKRR